MLRAFSVCLLTLLVVPGVFAEKPATSQLVELVEVDPRLRLDIRYAREDNFLGFPVYKEARAFLVGPAARALKEAHGDLLAQGYGLIVFDGYRPWSVTKIMWDVTPPEKRRYVADPSKGSRHNRGCAVDLTLCDPETGRPLEMPTGYDDFTEQAHADAPVESEAARRHREILISAMERHGFKVYPYEWWHFDYQGWEEYPIMDTPFQEIAP